MVDRANKPSAISAPAPSSAKNQPSINFNDDSSILRAGLPSGESVEILLHGATVISWKSAGGKENLWLSEKAILDGSKPVRGGIPVVFPVFGPPPKDHATSKLPQHGFARSTRWEYLGKSTSESSGTNKGNDDAVKLDFGLSKSSLPPDTASLWPHDFNLIYSVTLSPTTLQTMINVQNPGTSDFEFQFLLHTYLATSSISKTAITGLAGTTYIDRVLDASTQTQSTPEIKITGEVDRVYTGIKQDTTSVMVDGKPTFDVIRDKLSDTVVWNPWKEKANGMGDFAPKDGYEKMVCVEVGAVSGWLKLEPKESWEGGQTIKAL